MAEVTLEIVYYAGGSGPHTRQPRSTTQYGGFVPIDNLSGSLGDFTGLLHVTLGEMQKTVTDPTTGTVYTFAFVNISGGTPNGVNSFDPNIEPPPVTVGSAPVTVLVVYLPPPNGNGKPLIGASIDAFDETAGTLVDDNFVTVAPDPDGSLTTSGNVDGWVPTTNTETIAAYAHITPTNDDFDKWVYLTSPEMPPAGLDFTAQQNTNYTVLALYKTPPPLSQQQLECDALMQSIRQMADHGEPGPRFTVAEWSAITKQLQECVSEGCLTQVAVDDVETLYLNYAEGKDVPPGDPPRV